MASPFNPELFSTLADARRRHRRTDNALVVTTICWNGSAPAPELRAALRQLRRDHPLADFRWQPLHRQGRSLHATPAASLRALTQCNLYAAPRAAAVAIDRHTVELALGLGIPVLLPTAWRSPVITDGVHGMIADYTDPAPIVAKLGRMLFDIDLRMRMTFACSQRDPSTK